MVRNQAAQAAGMSQAGGRGQEKRPAIGPGSGRTACGKREASTNFQYEKLEVICD
ncbi:hypothetical protein K1I48_23500 [Bacillus licheniformis]|uniref:hypothetical protein n=1 Tax=Bacillus subtilis group TaxID=653685 RepID=UPI001C63BC54|nr:hypothetical protein [Bacillus licheniformis]MBW7636390.1 hypothetical protein [Bacillus licheniformis]MED4507175.1 hypothetical protein [Bacillus licheniformis]